MTMFEDMKLYQMTAVDILKTPDLFFYLFDEWAVFDIQNGNSLFHDTSWMRNKPRRCQGEMDERRPNLTLNS